MLKPIKHGVFEKIFSSLPNTLIVFFCACILLLTSVREKVIECFFCRPHRSIVLKDNLMIFCFPGSTTSRAKRKKVSKLNHEKLKTQVYLFSRSCCSTSDSELYIACSECLIDYIIFISVKSHNYSILI